MALHWFEGDWGLALGLARYGSVTHKLHPDPLAIILTHFCGKYLKPLPVLRPQLASYTKLEIRPHRLPPQQALPHATPVQK